MPIYDTACSVLFRFGFVKNGANLVDLGGKTVRIMPTSTEKQPQHGTTGLCFCFHANVEFASVQEASW